MSKINFKNTGKSLEDFKKVKSFQEKLDKGKKKPIGILLPLEDSKKAGSSLFEMSYDLESQVKVNLKNLIITRKGEVVCKPDFGTSIIDLYNRTDLDDMDDVIMSEISDAVSKYMPYVSLINFFSKKIESTSENKAHMLFQIQYNVNQLNENNFLEIKLLTSG